MRLAWAGVMVAAAVAINVLMWLAEATLLGVLVVFVLSLMLFAALLLAVDL